MNRRSFFTKLGLAAASVAILPAATTYARKWVAPAVAQPLWVPNPAWVNAPYECLMMNTGISSELTYEYLQTMIASLEAPIISGWNQNFGITRIMPFQLQP